MKRLVETDRWKDTWFVELLPYSKLLLSYIYDNCDEAGFIDVNYPIWQTQLKMTREQIFVALKALQPALLSDKKKKLFIIDFLKHQKKLPLVKGQEEAEWIINKLKSNLEKFANAPAILNILENHIDHPQSGKKSKGETGKKKPFVKPSFEEMKEYYLSEEPSAKLNRIQDLFDHYEKVGWVVGKNKPMVDWHAAVRQAIRRDKEDPRGGGGYSNNGGGNSPNGPTRSRTETTLSVADELKKNA